MGKKVIYIAGATEGKQNQLDLEAVEEEIIEHGFIPLSLSYLPDGLCDRKIAQLCTAMINSADAVFLLNNWPSDKNATFAKRFCEFTEKLYSTRLNALFTVLLER